MTLRPIYRWKSFWLGVVMLVCVGWGWQQAMRMNQWAMVSTPGLILGITQSEGHAGLFVTLIKEKWGISSGSDPRKDAVWFPASGKVNLSQVNGPYHPLWQFRARFAHWVLLLAVLVGWAALLRWRWRREQGTIT